MRQAVELIGQLIDEYGYFFTGETLLVGDEKEDWVFEMCALSDDEYHSAWAAQWVPDGQVFVAANEFRIRGLDPKNPDQLWSKLLDLARRKAAGGNRSRDRWTGCQPSARVSTRTPINPCGACSVSLTG